VKIVIGAKSILDKPNAPVKNVVIHRNYDSKSTVILNDLALVVLENDVPFNSRINRIPIANFDVCPGSYVNVAGYGSSEQVRR